MNDETGDPSDYLLKVRVEVLDSTVTLHPSGDLDVATARVLEAALSADLHEIRSVVVDLAGVTFIDSTGIATLLEAHSALLDDGRVLTVQNPAPQTQRVLELTGVADLLADRHDDS